MTERFMYFASHRSDFRATLRTKPVVFIESVLLLAVCSILHTLGGVACSSLTRSSNVATDVILNCEWEGENVDIRRIVTLKTCACGTTHSQIT